jgi:hypothetical protein
MKTLHPSERGRRGFAHQLAQVEQHQTITAVIAIVNGKPRERHGDPPQTNDGR